MLTKYLLATLVLTSTIAIIFADPCTQYTSCMTCAGRTEPKKPNSACVWCEQTNECMSQTTSCPSNTIPAFTECPDDCHNYHSCKSCVSNSPCQWCASLSRCENYHSKFSCSRWLSNDFTCNFPNARVLIGIFAALLVGFVVFVVFLAVWIRNRRRRALAEQAEREGRFTEMEMQDSSSFLSTTSSYPVQPAYTFTVPTNATSNPIMTNAVPGFIYASSHGDNQPSYLYTAVPVGVPVASIPQ